MTDYKRKLIEVALPLDEMNAASKADKGRAHGTIKNIHKWFAPMPVPAWRALLYAALIDDPGDEERRSYHLGLIKRLVANGADLPDHRVLEEARRNIGAQFGGEPPMVMDPFCGGGSTLVEAQRLGLSTQASDLNPVPALISRTLTELLPPLADHQPLHGGTRPAKRSSNTTEELRLGGFSRQYQGLDGLSHDVAHYAEKIRVRVEGDLRKHYPREDAERPVAWIWGREALCPNPACGARTVLTTSWVLSKRPGETAWITPIVEGKAIRLDVTCGQNPELAPPPPKTGRGGSFACLVCGDTISDKQLDIQAATTPLPFRLLAVVSDRSGRRLYRAAMPREEEVALRVPVDAGVLANIAATDGTPRRVFEAKNQAELYTPRQLMGLGALADAVANTYEEVLEDGGDEPWALAIVTLLGLILGRTAQGHSTEARLAVRPHVTSFETAFPRNDLPMTWDFYEGFLFGTVGPSWSNSAMSVLRTLKNVVPGGRGRVMLADARSVNAPRKALVATDPPYFDAIGYADLSDYFYVWHRRALRAAHPDLYGTIATPKAGELTAIPGRHGGRDAARDYFIQGFTETFLNLRDCSDPSLPILVVYASKEQKGGVGEESRWSSILTAMIAAQLEITGTWPILGTTDRRMLGQNSNTVATYVVMICRPRAATAATCSLADFNRALRRELRPAISGFQAAGILPVDLAQAAMGPGMQVYSRYRNVLDQSGAQVSVDQALKMINAALDEVLDEQQGELDPYSRFAVAWWERHGWDSAVFGLADQLARPQGISVDDVKRAGVALYPRPGFVSLLGAGDLSRDWKPEMDRQPTAWEAVHHLAERLIDGGGVLEAGRLMGELGVLRDSAQALVYRLHAIAAKKGRAKDQERYNALIGSWSDLIAASATERDGLF